MRFAPKVGFFRLTVFGIRQSPETDSKRFFAIMNRQSQIVVGFFFLGVFLKPTLADLVFAIGSHMGIRQAVSARVVILFVQRTKPSFDIEEFLIPDEMGEVEKFWKTWFAQFLCSPLALLRSNKNQFFCS